MSNKDPLVEALVGALLESYWETQYNEACCPTCWRCGLFNSPHKADCSLDAALTLAGFPTYESREAENKRRDALKPVPTITGVRRFGINDRGYVDLSDGTWRMETDDEFGAYLNKSALR